MAVPRAVERLPGDLRPRVGPAVAVAQAAWAADDVEGALAESRAALDIKPDLEMGALFHAQALSRRSMADAMTFLERFLERHPKSNDVRLAYARLLSAEKRPAEARKQFENLFPDGADLGDLPKFVDLALGRLTTPLQHNDFSFEPLARFDGSKMVPVTITRQPGDQWIFTTRRWAVVTWFFQSTGVILGAGWAYAVLGWGGYWAWDPVENASFMPWLLGIAFDQLRTRSCVSSDSSLRSP